MWDPKKAVQKNLSDLGLAFDANSVIKCSSTKAGLIERAKKSDGNPWKKIEEQKEENMVRGAVYELHYVLKGRVKGYARACSRYGGGGRSEKSPKRN